MEQDEIKSEDAAPSNPKIQLIGKFVNYGLMIMGAIAIIYFITTGEILGLS